MLAGCASAGNKIDPDAVSKIEKGVTTKAQVIALLGNPMSVSLLGDGREMLFWSYARTRLKGATFVPVVGLFKGGSNTNTNAVQVLLNKDKIVEDFTSNDSTIESKMGG